MNGTSLKKGFVPLTGGSMAVYISSGLAYYRHSDWLKSSRFSSTPSRGMYSDGAYAPFGEPYAQTGKSDLSFTGMNQDTAANLYDFPGREYGIQGRWPSADPSGLSSVHLMDPQTLNRYAYARNAPASVIDPSGLATAPAGGTGVTIDFYIPTATVPGGGSLIWGLGDGRGTDPNGGSYREEIQITYGPDQDGKNWLTVTVVPGVSQAEVLVPNLDGVVMPVTLSASGQITDLPGAGATIQYQANQDGSVTVQVNTSAINGFADYPGPAPANPINASITATMNPDGTGSINGGTYSGYPSLEGWSYKNGIPTLLEDIPAGSISQLGTNSTPIPPSYLPPSSEMDSPIGGGGSGDDQLRDYLDTSPDDSSIEDAVLLLVYDYERG